MQIPDYIPEHQLHSTEHGTDEVWDDESFEVKPEEQEAEVSEEKKAPRRARTKDQE